MTSTTMTPTIRRRLLPVFLTALGLVLSAATAASAQTKLRWNLKKGEKFQFITLQEMKMTVTVQGRKINTDMNMNLYSSWTVGEKNEAGASQVTQTIDRMAMKMTSPLLNFNYDSADKEEPQGLAKQIGTAFGAVVGAGLQFRISPEGDISDTKFEEKAAAALKKNPLTAQVASMFSEDGLRQMIGQLGAKFPTKGVKKGDTWTETMEQDVAGIGKMKTTMKFTYQGTASVEGSALEKISFTMNIDTGQFKGPGGATIKIKDQSSKGVLYFDNQRGHFTSSTIEQQMTMETSIGGQTFDQNIDITAKTTMTPVGK